MIAGDNNLLQNDELQRWVEYKIRASRCTSNRLVKRFDILLGVLTC